MRFVLYPFMALAAVGLVLSLTVHLMAVAGIPVPGGQTVFALHVGIFVVWIPAVVVSGRMTRNAANRRDAWKLAFLGCPPWMRNMVRVFFFYAIFNFLLFFVMTAGHSTPAGGAPPSVVRGFSGHWMVFYAAAFAIMYSAIHAGHLLQKRRCPRGHAVSHLAAFCPDCGAKLSPS